MIQHCYNCLHGEKDGDEEPCSGCVHSLTVPITHEPHFSAFEPKPTDKEREAVNIQENFNISSRLRKHREDIVIEAGESPIEPVIDTLTAKVKILGPDDDGLVMKGEYEIRLSEGIGPAYIILKAG